MTIDDHLDLGRSYLRFSQAWRNYLRAGGPGVAPSAYSENVTAAMLDLEGTYAQHRFDPDHILEIKAKAIRYAKAHLFF